MSTPEQAWDSYWSAIPKGLRAAHNIADIQAAFLAGQRQGVEKLRKYLTHDMTCHLAVYTHNNKACSDPGSFNKGYTAVCSHQCTCGLSAALTSEAGDA